MLPQSGLKIIEKLATQDNIVIVLLVGILLVSWRVVYILWKDNQILRKDSKDIGEKMLAALLTFDSTLSKVIENGSRNNDSIREVIKTQCELLLAKLHKR